MVDVVAQTNQKLISSFTNVNVMNVIGWIALGLIVIGACVYGYIWWKNKKLYNKIIEVYEIIGNQWERTYLDAAKNVKVGTGGFVIFYLRKLKTWKIAYGGKIGKKTYAFYIMPDGYWYNGVQSANVYYIDELKGMIPVVSTNPSMRAQYTSLEKQIDTLHADKKSFMDKYGSWVFGIAFVLVAGVMLWLSYKEYANAMGTLAVISDKQAIMIDKINNLLTNSQQINIGGGGLVPVK